MPPVVVMVVVFIALKLAGVIDWGWWWVLSPFLVNLALNAVVLIYNTVVDLFVWISARRDRAARIKRMMKNRAMRKEHNENVARKRAGLPPLNPENQP